LLIGRSGTGMRRPEGTPRRSHGCGMHLDITINAKVAPGFASCGQRRRPRALRRTARR
jgi:hypothetical protein